MPADMFFLSDEDRELLKWVLNEARQRRIGLDNNPNVRHEDPEAPEIYIAKTVSAIPAFTSPDTPGKATDADFYRLRKSGGVEHLEHASVTDRAIHNLSTGIIPADTWTQVMRDKFGTWWSVSPAAVSASTGFHAVLTAKDPIPGNFGYKWQKVAGATSGSVPDPVVGSISSTYNAYPVRLNAADYLRSDVGLQVWMAPHATLAGSYQYQPYNYADGNGWGGLLSGVQQNISGEKDFRNYVVVNYSNGLALTGTGDGERLAFIAWADRMQKTSGSMALPIKSICTVDAFKGGNPDSRTVYYYREDWDNYKTYADGTDISIECALDHRLVVGGAIVAKGRPPANYDNGNPHNGIWMQVVEDAVTNGKPFVDRTGGLATVTFYGPPYAFDADPATYPPAGDFGAPEYGLIQWMIVDPYVTINDFPASFFGHVEGLGAIAANGTSPPASTKHMSIDYSFNAKYNKDSAGGHVYHRISAMIGIANAQAAYCSDFYAVSTPIAQIDGIGAEQQFYNTAGDAVTWHFAGGILIGEEVIIGGTGARSMRGSPAPPREIVAYITNKKNLKGYPNEIILPMTQKGYQDEKERLSFSWGESGPRLRGERIKHAHVRDGASKHPLAVVFDVEFASKGKAVITLARAEEQES